MGLFLESLLEGGPSHAVEKVRAGFLIVPKPDSDPESFNEVVREILRRADDDYVALPRSDGRLGYDLVLIVPVDGSRPGSP